MAYFYKDILAGHTAFELPCKLRTLVVMKKVLGNPCPLSLPITPDTHCAVVDVVSSHYNIDSCVHLDTCDLSSAKLHHIVDVMNVVVLDNAENTAHTSNDTALLAVMDIIATNDVATDLFF